METGKQGEKKRKVTSLYSEETKEMFRGCFNHFLTLFKELFGTRILMKESIM